MARWKLVADGHGKPAISRLDLMSISDAELPPAVLPLANGIAGVLKKPLIGATPVDHNLEQVDFRQGSESVCVNCGESVPGKNHTPNHVLSHQPDGLVRRCAGLTPSLIAKAAASLKNELMDEGS